MDIILVLLVGFAGSYLLSRAFGVFGLPRVLAPILFGMVMGLPVIKTLLFDSFTLQMFNHLSNLGLISLLFYVGLRIDFGQMRGNTGQLLWVAAIGALIPFILGTSVLLLLDYPLVTSMIVGAAFAVSAEGIVVSLLQEERMLTSKVGRMIIGAGVIDDVVEVIAIAGISIVIISTGAGDSPLFDLVFDFSLFFGFLLCIRYLFLPLITRFLSYHGSGERHELFTATMIIVLAVALFTEHIHLGFAIGALIAGLSLKYVFDRNKGMAKSFEKDIVEMVEIATFGVMSLFFFLWIGLNVDFVSLVDNIQLGIIFVVVAVAGKWMGAMVGYLSGGPGSFAEANLIGWGMNARGAVELIIVEIARQEQLISAGLFSAVVFMSFCSTFLSPIMFKIFLSHYKRKHVVIN